MHKFLLKLLSPLRYRFSTCSMHVKVMILGYCACTKPQSFFMVEGVSDQSSDLVLKAVLVDDLLKPVLHVKMEQSVNTTPLKLK